ncbi:hypothetical protein RhiJN_16682 [Ceratobasidium sp. AG-Ba]|nr:hypothetical protein RhiJN_16682 [Ceratobasidium sp. AG-Ba]
MSLIHASTKLSVKRNTTLPHFKLDDISKSEPTTQPRRSQRKRWPSARRVESDEYEVLQRKSDPQVWPWPKPKQKKLGKPGNRLGLTIQPPADTGPTSRKGLQGSNINNSRMESADPGDTRLSPTSRAQAVCNASSILGADVLRYSASTLKQIIALGEAIRQDVRLGSMENKMADSPSLRQSAKQVGLASKRHSSAKEIADGADATQARGSQAAPTLEQSQLELPNNDTNTKPQSNSDHIRPKDSISQRVPLPVPCPTTSNLTQHPAPRTGSPSDSNREHEEETVHLLKRQQTLLPPLGPLPLARPPPLSRPLSVQPRPRCQFDLVHLHPDFLLLLVPRHGTASEKTPQNY